MSKTKSVLNIGGTSKNVDIPDLFKDFNHVLLDNFVLDKENPPDLVMDAVDIVNHDWMKEQYDAVYCSHVLEHLPRRKTGPVFRGIYHVLKPDGFALIRVPDVARSIQHMLENKRQFHEQVYPDHENPILRKLTYHGVIYGSDEHTEWNAGMRHLQAFTVESLRWAMGYVGFKHFFSSLDNLEILLVVFKDFPTREQLDYFSIEEYNGESAIDYNYDHIIEKG